MYQKAYNSYKYWYRKIDDAQYEVIKIESERLNGGRRRVSIYSRIVDLTQWNDTTVIGHWRQHRSFNEAYRHYGRNIDRYKGDMAYRIAEALGWQTELARFDNFEDLTSWMRDNQAEDFSIIDYVTHI